MEELAPEEPAEVAEIEEPTASEPEQEAAEPVGDDTPEQPKKSGVDKRIAELTYKRREAERKAEEAERRAKEAHELAMRLAGGEQKAESKPTLEDYDYDQERYAEAVADWKISEFRKNFEQERNAEAEKAEKARQEKELNARITKSMKTGRDEFPDFVEVVEMNNDTPVTSAMLEAITHAETPHRVAYYLGKNPDKAEEIANMPMQRQYMEIARLDVTLNTKPPKKKTSAPDPVAPVGGANEKGIKNPDDLPVEDWMRLRREGKL